MSKVISEFSKNTQETIRVSITEFKGYELIDVRAYYRDNETGELKPTRKGITLSIELYDKLKDAILELGKAISKEG
jgi:hypothetical protein